MGFSKDSIDFLIENKLNDSREWFLENKGRYQQSVYFPMVQLVEALTPGVLELDPHIIVQAKTGKTISRIYRDIRFAKDKSLFRENMWFVFERDKKSFPYSPGFVFEISPNGFRYGCGHYYVPPAHMLAMRSLILKNDKRFLSAKKAVAKQKTFHMEGECYKRNRFTDQPEELQLWLNRKCIAFLHESDDLPLLFSDDLAQVLQKGFLQLAPVYHFLCAVSEMAN